MDLRAQHRTAMACIGLAATSTLAHGQATTDEAAQPALAQLEAVLVTGEQPGPGLWKISNAEHTLWILGTYAPLPKQMTWRSAQADVLIAESQAFLVPGGVRPDIDIGFFQSMTLLPSMFKAGDIPDDARLADLLPPDVYAKWLVLQRKYMPHFTAESLRPSFAAQSLRNNVKLRSGLEGDAGVWVGLKKTARKHKVQIVTLPMHKVELKVKGARAVLKKFEQTPVAGIECFTKTVEEIERDFEVLKARANAWASGDVKELRQLREKQLTPGCADELINELLAVGFAEDSAMSAKVAKFNEDMRSASQSAEQEWLEATESALGRNKSTFAVMPIGALLKADGFLSQMRARGYAVEEPD